MHLERGSIAVWYQSDLCQQRHFSSFLSGQIQAKWKQIHPWFQYRTICTTVEGFQRIFDTTWELLNSHCCFRFPNRIFQWDTWSCRFLRYRGKQSFCVFIGECKVGWIWKKYPWWQACGSRPKLGGRFQSRSCRDHGFGVPRSQQDAWKFKVFLWRGW